MSALGRLQTFDGYGLTGLSSTGFCPATFRIDEGRLLLAANRNNFIIIVGQTLELEEPIEVAP
jgi:hypothetical protein